MHIVPENNPAYPDSAIPEFIYSFLLKCYKGGGERGGREGGG